MTQKLSEDIYLSERASLIEEERQQSRLFDRGVLTLTAGAFGLSFLLLQSIENPRELFLIGFGWLGFCMSLLSTMVSFLCSQEAYRRQVEILDNIQNADSSQRIDFQNCWERYTKWLNWGSLFGLLVGIICLAVFAYRNFS